MKTRLLVLKTGSEINDLDISAVSVAFTDTCAKVIIHLSLNLTYRNTKLKAINSVSRASKQGVFAYTDFPIYQK